ncbi:MAG: alpha/beta hydrolase [Polyangiales bacterium]
MTVVAGAIGLWLAIALLASCSYRSLLYPAPSGAPAADKSAEVRTFHAKDGVAVHAVVLERQDAPMVVCFHGNGELAEDSRPFARELNARGLGVVLVEYRGYGASASAGKPTEQGLYADAEAVLDGLAMPKDRIVLFGRSLGTGVATEMAVRGRGRALILVAPYTSIPAVASRMVPFLPVSWIVGDRYDNLSKAPRVEVPTLIFHGDADEVIPYDMGVTLSKAIKNARLSTVAGAHHNDIFAHADLVAPIAAHALK